MSTLQEFLKERADRIREGHSEKLRLQNEWIQAVDRLIRQIRQWLSDADSQNILEFFENSIQLRETDVGVYLVKRLTIRLEAQEVHVIPIARNAVGPVVSSGSTHRGRSFGRVDITDGVNKFLLFRTQIQPDDRWVIVNDENYIMRELNEESFASAMQSLLQ
jgi:hypothetical protein